jgi:hypothetical protein
VSFVYFLFGGKFGRRAKKRHETHSIGGWLSLARRVKYGLKCIYHAQKVAYF